MKKKIFLVLAAFLLLTAIWGGISSSAEEPAAEAVESPTLKIKGAALILGNSVDIQYIAEIDGVECSDVKLLVWENVPSAYLYGTQKYAVSYMDGDTLKSGGITYPYFRFTNAGAKMMTKDYYAVLYANTELGEMYSTPVKYSILNYAYNKLGKTGTATTNALLVDLLEGMLEYGALAQKYLKYETDRLANDDYYQIKVSGGTLEDGFKTGLYLEGESVVITAPETNAVGETFAYWTDGDGNKVSDTATYELTVETQNEVYTSNYIKYSVGLEFFSNGDGTCCIDGMGDCEDTVLIIPPVSPGGDVVTEISGSAFSGIAITSVSFPNTIEIIGSKAFYDCASLTDVYYDGTEEEWNEKVSVGSRNTPIENATKHFIAPETFTVTFVDYDGTTIKTETVNSGNGAIAPNAPRRNGYTFIGWDKEFDNVTGDLTVTAQYEIVENQTCINYTDNGDGTTTAKFSINGDVNIAMLELQLRFDLNNATYKDYEILAAGSADANYTEGIFYFSFMSTEDVTEDTDLFSIIFDNSSASVGITFTVVDSYVSDGTFTNVTTVNIVGTTYNS